MPKQLKIVVCEIWCVKTLRLNGRKKMITKGGGNDFAEKYRPLVGNGDDEKLT